MERANKLSLQKHEGYKSTQLAKHADRIVTNIFQYNEMWKSQWCEYANINYSGKLHWQQFDLVLSSALFYIEVDLAYSTKSNSIKITFKIVLWNLWSTCVKLCNTTVKCHLLFASNAFNPSTWRPKVRKHVELGSSNFLRLQSHDTCDR